MIIQGKVTHFDDEGICFGKGHIFSEAVEVDFELPLDIFFQSIMLFGKGIVEGTPVRLDLSQDHRSTTIFIENLPGIRYDCETYEKAT